MYDTDTVRHITGCIRRIEDEQWGKAATAAKEAETPRDPDEQNQYTRADETHTAIAKAFQSLRYELEGDYAG